MGIEREGLIVRGRRKTMPKGERGEKKEIKRIDEKRIGRER